MYTKADASILETRISAIRTDGLLNQSVQNDTGMEHLRELETIGRLDLKATDPSYTFSSVALISTGDPNREYTYPKPVSTGFEAPEGNITAFFWTPDRKVVDVLLLSFSGRTSASIDLELDGQAINLTIPPDAEVGFIRLRRDATGPWEVEPEYVYNVKTDLSLVGTMTESPIESANRLQIHPNPIRKTAEIEFGIEQSGSVHLSIFDSQGREVVILIDSILNPGLHRTIWSSSALASGVYFLRLSQGLRRETKPFVVKR